MQVRKLQNLVLGSVFWEGGAHPNTVKVFFQAINMQVGKLQNLVLG